MANWLEKVKKQNLPAVLRSGPLSTQQRVGAPPKKIPAASIIYGAAAIFFGTIGIYFLFTGRWFTGGLVLFLAACFLGFALHFAKHG
jgi:hypothetical protein